MAAPHDAACPRAEAARKLFATARSVVFDVDSTVSCDEGIDVLASAAGVGERVAAITHAAMSGGSAAVRFEDALAARLECIRPTRALVERVVADHPPRLTPYVHELVAALHARGSAVYLVSGGFIDMVAPVAAALHIPAHRVVANRLLFDAENAYVGFDTTCFTSRTGGKALAVAHIAATVPDARPLIVVGDGVTDAEARVSADAFIGYGGVVTRPAVQAVADWFVTDFRELLACIVAAPRL